jgi:Protein of unknown function (DUF2946)
MRRSWLQVVLFFVAITLQVLAPIAGNLAHAKVFKESGISSVLCEASGTSHHQDKGSQSRHAANKHCLLCQSICDSLGFTLEGGQSGLISTNAWIIGAFPAQLDTSPASRETARYQARAPPTLISRLG